MDKNYPLTKDDLQAGKKYKDNKGNYWIIKPNDSTVYVFIFQEGAKGQKQLPQPYDISTVRFCEIEDVPEFAAPATHN